MQNIAKAISWIFLPLFMPIYGLCLTFYVPSQELDISKPSLFALPPQLKTQILFLFLVFVTIAPGVSFILMYRKGLLSSVEMEERKERLFPLFILFSYCILLFFLFWKKAPGKVLPIYIYSLPLTGAFVAAAFMLFTSRFKISLHAAGTGILTGYLCAFASQQIEIQGLLIIFSFLCSGITLWARLYLNKHKPIEVYLGWLCAFLITYSSILFLPLFL